MNKIGTHNSGTGEKSENLLSWLITPFAKCLSKTIKEQYESGCRYFDIRVDDNLNIRHGIWKSKITLYDVLNTLNNTDSYIMVTYEGSLVNCDAFINRILDITSNYNINISVINVKKPIWKVLWVSDNAPATISMFKNLDGSTWHTYIPIPWLWKKIYYNKPKFNSEYYTLVDFL